MPAARASWINPAFIYTHGYGLVLRRVSKITPDGLPVLLIDNAPPVVKTKSLTLTRPEIYYGEVTHEPVFVNTAQAEFNYPSGDDNVRSQYEGKGGFPISSFFMRAGRRHSRGRAEHSAHRLLHRQQPHDDPPPRARASADAGRLSRMGPRSLPGDHAIAGRLVWMVDGYTTSDAHPYSRAVDLGDLGRVNYIRNAVKATVDAYDGETHLYIFAPDDPLIGAYQRLFPKLFRAGIGNARRICGAHARYPETLFRVQAEIYRTYHMLDPQIFYNKEDLWDLARHASAQNGGSESVTPTYVVASLPGESQAEFLLMTPFTPRGKDNLIGLMAARCDGDASGRNRGADAFEAGADLRAHADRGAHQSGSNHFEGPDAVEPARLASVARPDAGAAGGKHVSLRGSHLHPGHRSAHAAIEEGGAGGGQPPDLHGHLRRSAGAAWRRNPPPAQPAGAAAAAPAPQSPAAPELPAPMRACSAFATTCESTMRWPRKAGGRKPARSWKPSKPK